MRLSGLAAPALYVYVERGFGQVRKGSIRGIKKGNHASVWSCFTLLGRGSGGWPQSPQTLCPPAFLAFLPGCAKMATAEPTVRLLIYRATQAQAE